MRIALALVIAPLTAAAVAVAALAEAPGDLTRIRLPQAAGVELEVQPPAPAAGEPPAAGAIPPAEEIRWRRSTAVGTHTAGRLVRGVRLPAERVDFFTWDPVLRRSPNRPWRRWGTDRLIRVVLEVAREFHAAHPLAPRIAVGDISRTHGGNFGPQFGSIGHSSHQNGLDADIYYPRADWEERAPKDASQIDRRLAQDLVKRFLAHGAAVIFVGPNTGLRGPPGRVQALVEHDDHLHVRLHLAARARVE